MKNAVCHVLIPQLLLNFHGHAVLKGEGEGLAASNQTSVLIARLSPR